MNTCWLRPFIFIALVCAGAIALVHGWNEDPPPLTSPARGEARSKRAPRAAAIRRLRLQVEEDRLAPAGLSKSAEAREQNRPDHFPQDRVVMSGRAVDANGQPLVADQLWLEWRSGSRSGAEETRPESDGRFQIVCGDLAPADVDSIHVNFTLLLPDADYPIATSLADPVSVSTRHVQLGDLRFVPPPVVLTGQFKVPPSLEHLEKVEMTCGWPSGKSDNLDEIDGCQIEWHQGLEFTVRGFVSPGNHLRLKAASGPYRHAGPLDFVSGTRGLVIQLHQGCEFRATVLVDEWVEDSDYLYWLTPADEVSAMRSSDTLCHADLEQVDSMPVKRVIRRPGLQPGRYRLEITAVKNWDPLVQIDNIVLSLDGKKDPRLDAIDLRGTLRQIKHHVIDADTERPLGGSVTFLTRSPGASLWTWAFPHDLSENLVVPDQVDIMIIADNYKMALVTPEQNELDIRMSKSPGMTLQLRMPQPVPNGASVSIVLTPRLPADIAACTVVGKYHDKPLPLRDSLSTYGSIDSHGAATIHPHVDMPHDVAVSLCIDKKFYEYTDFSPKLIDLGVQRTEPFVIDVAAPPSIRPSVSGK